MEINQLINKQTNLEKALKDVLRERDEMFDALYRSTSWRLTTPVRWLGLIIRRLARLSGLTGIRRPRPRAKREQRIFLEVTHTHHSKLNTGIQRVVRNVLRSSLDLAGSYGLKCTPVIFRLDELYNVDPHRTLLNKKDIVTSASNEFIVEHAHSKSNTLVDYRYNVSNTIKIKSRLKVIFDNNLNLFRTRDPDHLGEYASHVGHVLVLLDASWTTPLWEPVREFRRRGGVVVSIIYDLIPLTHPHTTIPNLAEAFEVWLGHHFDNTDGFVTISASVKNQLLDYAKSKSIPRIIDGTVRVDHFHLGSELDFANDPGATIRPEIEKLFSAEAHAFLMVGSIEPRKMHDHVLDAFDTHWGGGNGSCLIICGQEAWMTEAFIDRVAHHVQLGTKLFLLRDASDAELIHLYKKASALIIASETEGFGLPIVEAFQQGLPVICSDIPVFREIAEGRARFFSLESPNVLAHLLDTFVVANDLDCRYERKPVAWLNWNESTRQLMDKVVIVAKEKYAK